MNTPEYKIGQEFIESYPPAVARWCNANGAHIEEDTAPEAKVRSFKIVRNKPLSLDAEKKRYERAVQAHLDETAQSRGYDDAYTCISYQQSTDEVWRTEANIFLAWRDAVWRRCHEILNAFTAEEIPQPTVEEVIATLPKINWEGA